MIINLSNFGGGGGGGYVLPIASQSTLGGVKVGQNLTIDSGGTLNAVGGEQDYQIVTAITDYSAGKMYGIVDESEYEKTFTGTVLYCGNQHTDFVGVVEDNNSNSSFNPWVQGNTMFIDAYIDRDASTGINTLTVKYGNDTIITETLSEGDNVFALPTLETLSGVILTVTVETTESNIVYSVVYSGSSLYENKYFIHPDVWNYNENIMLEQASTFGNEPRFDRISYTDGKTAHSITDVASYSTKGVVQIGSGLSITSSGVLSANAQPVGIATTAQTGVVKIGSGIDVDSAGTISVSAQIPTKLQSTGIENVVNDNFALVYTLEDLGIWTTDNSGYTIDLSYVSEDFIGNIGNGSSLINGYQNGVSFGVEITADGLKTSCVDTDDWILLYELTGLTYGTYTVGSGETYEAVIEITPDNKFSVHFTNGLAYPPDLAYGGVFTPVWKQENVLYKIKQRQPIATTGHTGMVKVGDYLSIDASGTLSVNASSITNGVSFWKGTQAEYDALSGTTGYDSSTLYIITDTPNAV